MTEESIAEILLFFKKYEIATGATINLSKTKIMTLGNAKHYNLDQKVQNIAIIEPNSIYQNAWCLFHYRFAKNQYL